MAGDLNKWKGSDLATSPSVQFFRKGGWFVSKSGALLIAGLVILAILLTAILTKVLTEQYHENEGSVISKIGPDYINGFDFNDNSDHNPLSYDLQFNHSSDTFNGDMIMRFQTKNNSNSIYLKFKGKYVYSPRIECFDGIEENTTSEVIISSMVYNKSNSNVNIKTAHLLPENQKCNLQLKFQGAINPEEKGIFKIPYTVPVNDSKFEDRWVIGANLAPNYCSSVFPCIEDESVRVSYRLKLLRHANYSSVSNIFQKAVRDVSDFPELMLDDYQWTPPLPLSSLSYFVLPDYKVKTIPGSNISVNIWYPLHLENTTTPLATVASVLLPFYDEYFQTHLPIKRISLVIVDGLVTDIPGKLGLIPISSSLLYSPELQSYKREERLYYYLGQKLCNLWLGNLVNFKSLSDNWINEGFALYMTDLAAAKNFLFYDVSTFHSSVQEKAFHDGLNKYLTTKNTDFKGAYLIHMISNIIEPSLFKKGVQNFMQKWMYNSTEPNALWSSLNMVQNEFDVVEFVNSWNKSSRIPIVTVENKNGNISITQVLEMHKLWKVPITYTSGEHFDMHQILMKDENTKNISIGSNNTWIIVNPNHAVNTRGQGKKEEHSAEGQNIIESMSSIALSSVLMENLPSQTSSVECNRTKNVHVEDNNGCTYQSQVLAPNQDESGLKVSDGDTENTELGQGTNKFSVDYGFFLTNYSLELWSTLTEEMLDGSINFPNMVQSVLIHDSFTLAGLNLLDYEVPLNLSLFLREETNLAPWFTAMKHIKFIAPFLNETEDIANFKEYLRDIINSSLSLINNSEQNNIKPRQKSLESELLHWSCEFNITNNCSLEASKLEDYSSCYAVRANGSTSMEEILNKSRLSITEPYMELNILTSLMCTSNVTLLKRVLNHSLDISDPFFSPKKTLEMWLALKEFAENSRIAFEHVKENWSSIYNRFKNESEILRAILESSTYALTEEAELNEVKNLKNILTPYDKEVRNVLNNIIQQVNYNIDWKKTLLSNIKSWLSKTYSISVASEINRLPGPSESMSTPKTE